MPMRIRGLFLRSRVARRTFWVLLAAALVPLMLFALLAAQVYVDQQRQQSQREESEFLKHIGLRAYDRLTAARSTLAAHAAERGAETPWAVDPAVRALLRNVATLAPDGTAHGDATLLADWRRAGGGQAQVQPEPRDLWWLPRENGVPGRVFIDRPDAHGRGRWVAEVSPAFLWADFAEDGPAAQLCLQDTQGQILRCPQTQASDAPRWSLFMKAGFGSPDWVLQGRRPRAGDGLVDSVLRIGVTAGVATMLLISVLGMVLVRRTMVPLEQLISGTRRLAAGDWAARVDERRDDEFGQLARLFNAMTGRIGRQVQTLSVQAAIDREILGGLNVPHVMRQVANRIQALVPGASVAVLALDAADGRWRVHRPDTKRDDAAAEAPLEAGALALPADGLLSTHGHFGSSLPGWLLQVLGWSPASMSSACWMPANWQGQPVALLAIAAAQPLTFDDEAQRELEALRDRCAVAIAAAQREHRLVERAVRDDLTGLLNRHGLHDACDDWLASADAAAGLHVMFVDLDGFKEVNDAQGHAAGDLLLRSVTDRLRSLLPPATVLARPGGDEFVALLPLEADVEALAEAICAGLSRPFMLRGQVQHIGASVGLATSPRDGMEREELLRHADLAMYAAKGDGRGSWRRYASTMDARASERAWMLRDLRQVIADRKLEVHYQPRLDLRTGRTCGAEALVRWRHPEHGWIPPVRFVPLAEESDLIVLLGAQVMAQAMAQCRRWRDAGVAVGRVAVNVSARQLAEDGFADGVLALLAQHGLQPGDLEIEVTESLFAGDPAMVQRVLSPLRSRGVVVALDDFGTGFSSLSALAQLPVDVMKIDRSFVIGLGKDPAADAVVRAVIALARDLGKRVVAEGVESALQEARLQDLGCDEVQGYRYAKPLAARLFEQAARTGFDAPMRETVEPAAALLI